MFCSFTRKALGNMHWEQKQYKSQNGESRAEITIRRLQTLNKEMDLNHVSNRVYPSLKGIFIRMPHLHEYC